MTERQAARVREQDHGVDDARVTQAGGVEVVFDRVADQRRCGLEVGAEELAGFLRIIDDGEGCRGCGF